MNRNPTERAEVPRNLHGGDSNHDLTELRYAGAGSVLNYPSMTSKSDFFFCGTDGPGGPAAPPV
jgi:hypothetical protein